MIELIKPLNKEKDIWSALYDGKEVIVTPTSEFPDPEGWMLLDDLWEEVEYISNT